MAHEADLLRNTARILTQVADIVTPLPDQLAEMRGTIQEQAERIDSLAHDLLIAVRRTPPDV